MNSRFCLSLPLVVAALVLGACSDSATDATIELDGFDSDAAADSAPAGPEVDAADDVQPDVDIMPDPLDATDPQDTSDLTGSEIDADITASDVDESSSFVVVTINGGTSPGRRHNDDEQDGLPPYTAETSDIVDEFYQNSLSWNPAEAALTTWLAETNPDIAVFQEIFHDPWCLDIDRPQDESLDLVCNGFTDDRRLQVQRMLGERYQYACGARKPDICIAIRRDFGTVAGCDAADCVIEWEGAVPLSDCTSRDRIGRVLITRADGTLLNLVGWHGTSGALPDDSDCRADQLRLVFEDAGDGEPLFREGMPNLLAGDFNFDPMLFVGADVDYLAARVGDGLDYQWLSPTDLDGPRSYGGGASIDHMISDELTGGCYIPGSSDGVPAVWERVYWDHRPVVCTLR
jgi:hypothetical protein